MNIQDYKKIQPRPLKLGPFVPPGAGVLTMTGLFEKKLIICGGLLAIPGLVNKSVDDCLRPKGTEEGPSRGTLFCQPFEEKRKWKEEL